MKAYAMLWRIVQYRLWLYAAIVVDATAFYLGRLVFGLVLQAFFNTLSGQTHLTPFLFILIGVLILTALLRALISLAGTYAIAVYSFSMEALLKRNLLQRILERPGAQAVPGSPGEAISSFRDDVQAIRAMMSITVDTIALSIFAIAAFIILLHVNAVITLLVLRPVNGRCGDCAEHEEAFREVSQGQP